MVRSLTRAMLLYWLFGAAAVAADWQTEWQRTVAEARGETLVLAIQGTDAFQAVVRAFQSSHPEIKVQVTALNPSSTAIRILAEQRGGLYAWDSWWAITSSMNSIVLPADGFEPITGYLLLPEVTDPSEWRSPAPLYTSPRGPYIFVHSVSVDTSILFNREVVRDVRVRSAADLLDPRLRGRIVIRDSSKPNSGTHALGGLLKENGSQYVQRLLNDTHPVFFENSRQLTDSVLRGDYAVGIGGIPDTFDECLKGGGCRSVSVLPFGQYLTSRGVGILKHPPHPAAATVWVNWLLSREGQEAYVRAWSQYELSGAVSLRLDVSPAAAQLGSVPRYESLDRYFASGFDSGLPELKLVESLYRDASRNTRRRPGVVAYAATVACLASIAVAGLGLIKSAGRGSP
jgi:ABC-type Fe3+ transport system substrate-binding protein